MTAAEKYRVVFNSQEIEKRYRRSTKRQMAKRFRLNRKKIGLLFSYKKITIKTNITFQEAVRLQLAIEKTGGACEIKPVVKRPASLLVSMQPELQQTEPLPDSKKPVSSWYDQVTETFVTTDDSHNSTPKVIRYRRQVEDRRREEDRRLAIRMEIDRRDAGDRRGENRVWKGGWRK